MNYYIVKKIIEDTAKECLKNILKNDIVAIFIFCLLNIFCLLMFSFIFGDLVKPFFLVFLSILSFINIFNIMVDFRRYLLKVLRMIK